MVNLVPLTGDTTTMVPVDVDRDPTGDLVIVGSRAGYTVRPVRDGEEPEGRFRRRAHWGVCPHVARWRDVMRAAGVVAGVVAGPTTTHDPNRAGPCVRCHSRHPWRYGGPIASPMCDRCREETGAPLMGEYD